MTPEGRRPERRDDDERELTKVIRWQEETIDCLIRELSRCCCCKCKRDDDDEGDRDRRRRGDRDRG